MQIPHFVRDDNVMQSRCEMQFYKSAIGGSIVLCVAFGHGMPCPY
ncbi:MAG TPA: hypothetical protein VGH17_00660 [Candidatus Acidoferrales bacterium]|jgi:hypothetical protein